MTEEINKKKSVKLQPHLAITHNELQSGASNGRNVSLLMKSVDITDEQKEILKSIVGEEWIEKVSYNGLRNLLNEAIEVYKTDKWSWAYVEDFDETTVVFSNSDGVYAVQYTLQDNKVVLNSNAIPVNRVISYETDSNSLVLSDSVDGVDPNVLVLIKKSFEKISNNDKLKSVFKSKQEKGKQLMEQEIQKAVDAAVGVMKTDLQKAQADLSEAKQSLEKAVAERDALQEKLDAIEKAAKEAAEAQRKEALKAVIADEKQVETLFKAFSALDDEAFAEVIKSYETKNEQLENGDLFVQKSGNGGEQEQVESNLAKMLREQYASK